MLYPRVYHTLVTLANGQVLAVGGEGTSDQSVVTTGVLPTEIWDPVSRDVVGGGADRGRSQLPLDRRAAAGRDRCCRPAAATPTG